jgi:hypothetical protein
MRTKWTCGTYGRDDTQFWLGNLKRRNHFEDLGVEARIISERISEKWDGK